jgi:hypothetical protein
MCDECDSDDSDPILCGGQGRTEQDTEKGGAVCAALVIIAACLLFGAAVLKLSTLL